MIIAYNKQKRIIRKEPAEIERALSVFPGVKKEQKVS
jgi:hypothetical protein